MVPRAWALSAYPVSATYHSAVEQCVGRPVDVAVLSELRRGGAVAILRTLVGTRRELGVVLLQDASSLPLAPVLRLLASVTRCRRLATVTADGRVLPFSRLRGILEAPRLLLGTLRGAVAAAECYLELKRLSRRRPRRHRLQNDRHVVYLKTNLWFGVKAGGSVGHVAGVANALAERSDRVDLFSVEEPPLLAPAIRFHPVVHHGAFGYPYEINYYVYQRAFARRIRSALGGAAPGVVYHRLSLANYSGLRLALDAGVPLVLEYNGSEVWVSRNWGRPLKLPRLASLAEDVALAHADLVVTVSEVLGQELRDRGIPAERILVHPNCVDPQRFDPSRHSGQERAELLAHYGIPPDATVCGFIGTFGLWHGVTLLAEAIHELALHQSAWLARHRVRFLLIGDGLLMPQVRETLASEAAAGLVTLTGLVEQDRAPSFLAACDVLLSPHVPNPDGSRFFGSPTKLFEYMAMARGIVASDLDQIGDVLAPSVRQESHESLEAGEELAVLVTPGSRDDFIRGLMLLVEQPKLRDQLGRNARRRVLERYTWDRNVDELLQRLRALSERAAATVIMPAAITNEKH